MKPLVSILIPAYNAEAWLSDTLKSAIAQTWDRKEIIVIDDGSKDGTLRLARNFESTGVRVFTQRNQGAAATRNNAFAQSRETIFSGWMPTTSSVPTKSLSNWKLLVIRRIEGSSFLGNGADSCIGLAGRNSHRVAFGAICPGRSG